MSRVFEEVCARIEAAASLVNFGNASSSPSDSWVAQRESEAGTSFPPSYKWWLKNFGGGEIGGEEVFSVYELPLEQVMAGDIVAVSKRSGALAEGRILLCWPSPGEQYYFRVDDPSPEKSVFWSNCADGSEEHYADSFADFLVRRIDFWSQ
jgi:hypothetical protein